MYRLKSPLTAQLELTDACNNACLHCYNYWRYLETNQRFSSDSHKINIEHFRSLLDYLIVNEVRTVTLTGGEPFLRRDVLFDLIVMAKRANMKVGVNTNGVLVTEDDVSRLKNAGTDFILVALLSDNAVIHNRMTNSNAHALTSGTIVNLVKADLNVAVNMVVSSYNWDRVRQTAIYVKDLGIKEFSATPILPCPLAKGHLDLLLKPKQVKQVLSDLLWIKRQGMKVDVLEPLVHCMFDQEERTRFSQFLDNRSCSAGISDMVISPTGDVRPCILATQTYGNLITDGWEKTWNNLASWCSPDLLPSDCLECAVVDECGGGCRVAALAVTNRVNGRDPYMTNSLCLAVSESDEDLVIVPKLSREATIAFPHVVSIRDEDFGCVVFRDRTFIFLDKDGAKLLRYLKDCSSFTFKSIVEEIDIDEDELVSFLSVLIGRGFLDLKSDERR